MSVADTLIPIINSLQDVFSTLSTDQQTIDLPQIVVVGSQSAGKSSVLEAICGRDILPRGSGIVTRRPLILMLIKTKGESVRDANGKEFVEWGEFLHTGDKKFVHYKDICKEIVDETDRITGGTKNVSSSPIRLKMYSPSYIPLTLVDLPGLVKNVLPDQPPDIDVQIARCVNEYIARPNSIILAVSAANADLANSDALNAATRVDPNGDRTVGVLTKIDIIDKGTELNIMKILNNEDFHLKLGWIAVQNRSQRDIDADKPINKHLKDEMNFFMTHEHFKGIASRQGVGFLTKRLNQVLINHIQLTLPDIRLKISTQLDKFNKELITYGQMPDDRQSKERMLLGMISDYEKEYKGILDGTSAASSKQELVGGARISYIFSTVLPKMFDTISINELLNGEDVRTLIRNSNGTRSGIFLSESAFELLVVKVVRLLERPCQQCLMLVKNELIQIARAIPTPEMSKYKRLVRELVNICCKLIDDLSKPTGKFLADMITAELSYINTNHPDFSNSSEVKGSFDVQRQIAGVPSSGMGQPDPFAAQTTDAFAAPGGPGGPGPRPMGPPMGAPGGPGPRPMGPPPGQNPNFGPRPGGPQGPMAPGPQGQRDVTPGAQLQGQAPPQGRPGGPLMPDKISAKDQEMSNIEKFGVELIPRLMQSYYRIIRKKVEDTVPKAIIAFLVKASKEQLQETLVRTLYSGERLDELLNEDPIVREKRQAARQMVEVLSRGQTILDRIGNIRSVDDIKSAGKAE